MPFVLQEYYHLLESRYGGIVHVDVVSHFGSEVRLRARASSRKIRRYCSAGLVGRVRRVAATVVIVGLSVDNVYRAGEGSVRERTLSRG